jgi:Fe-S-cluster containining protein
MPNITCEDCGACCRAMGKPPFLENELVLLPDHLRKEIEAIPEENAEPCIWLNSVTGQCKNYKLRPFICEEFPVGGESCKAYRKFYNIDVP